MVFLIQSGDIPTGTEWMNNMNTNLRQNGRNMIRQLQDRDIDFSADGGEFADAFDLSINQENGQKESVDLDSSNGYSYSYNSINPQSSTLTAFLGASHYVTDEASGDSTSDPDSFTDAANAFDEDLTTYAEFTGSTTAGSLGKTFGAKTVDSVFIKADAQLGTSTRTVRIKLQSYDGATWNDVETLLDSSDKSEDNNETYTIQKLVILESSVQGLRVLLTGTDISSMKVYSLAYGEPAAGTVVMDIPTGSFTSTISQSAAGSLVENWESGAAIDYKLTNATEDSGWLTADQVSSFTALTSEPTKVTVRLTPKTTSPTSGYPSIKGVWVTE